VPKVTLLLFDHLPFYSLKAFVSRSQEIVIYLSRLKNEDFLDKNIYRPINFLMGKEQFIWRFMAVGKDFLVFLGAFHIEL